MVLRGVLGSIAAVTLAATPLAAQAAASVEREAATVEGEQLRGTPWLPIVLVAVLLAGLLALSSGDKPSSP